MYVDICMDGIVIEIDSKDKKEINNQNPSDKTIECILNSHKKPKVVLHVVDGELEKSSFESPGFHIETTPKQGGPKLRTRYDIYLNKKQWKIFLGCKYSKEFSNKVIEGRGVFIR